MAARAFTLDGVSSADMGLVLTGVRPSLLPTMTPTLLEVPGRAGAYYRGMDVGTRVVELDVTFAEETAVDLEDRVRNVASWLFSDDVRKLALPDEGGKVRFVVVSGDTKLNTLFSTGRSCTLVFLQNDPALYADTEDGTPIVQGDNLIDNPGLALAFPREVLTFTSQATYVRLVGHRSELLMLGAGAQELQVPTPSTVLRLSDDCSSVGTWTTATPPPLSNDGGTIAGTMASNGYSISPKHAGGSFGAGAGWHGPTVRKPLSANAADFVMEFRPGLVNATANLRAESGRAGRIQVYGVADDGTVLFCCEVYDNSTAPETHFRCRIGTSATGTRIADLADRSGFLNFTGLVRLTRTGNRWTFYFCTYNANGTVKTSRTYEWVDAAGTYAAKKLSKIDVAINQLGTNAVLGSMYLDNIAVWEKIALNPDTQADILVKAGDVLTIDHANQTVYLNGERFLTNLDYTSIFFPLQPGGNVVTVDSDGAFTGNLYSTARWY